MQKDYLDSYGQATTRSALKNLQLNMNFINELNEELRLKEKKHTRTQLSLYSNFTKST
jgi:DNA-dependent RNA polymerase auxiliary subunit epsilon